MRLTRADFQTDREWLECCACRHTWPMRFADVPKGRGTWGDWYAARFGRSIETAAAEYGRMAQREPA